MRKVVLSVLLATAVATPALAAPTDRGDRNTAREERSQAREERSQARQERREQRSQAREERAQARDNRPAQGDRTAPAVVEHRDVQAERPHNVNERGRPTLGRVERMQDNRQSAGDRRGNAQQQQEAVENWRRQHGEDLARSDAQNRSGRGGFVQRRQAPPVGARPDRPAPVPQTANHRDRRDGHHRWNSDWRHDHRYNWRDHRRNHRSIFHVGLYFDPFGWGYHRYNVGWRLWPSYYSSNYWLNDPSMYRLPYAQWPYKWVRYYDDAILVDTMSGQVVDVIYDFFW